MEIYRKNRKCYSESNSFVSAAEQVRLQPVVEHDEADVTSLGRLFHHTSTPFLQQQERHDLRPLTDDRSERRAVSEEVDLSLRRCGMSATHLNDKYAK